MEKAPKRKWADLVSAALTIQRAFRRYKARKAEAEDLPDLKCADVAAATVMIQKSFRGFQVGQAIFTMVGDYGYLNFLTKMDH